MPVYAFTCDCCGSFDLARPMAAAGAPASCPACGGRARRVYTPPALAVLGAPVRRALDVEAKSAHDPDVVGEKRGRPMPHQHAPSPPWTIGH